MADHVETIMTEMLPELDDLRRKRIFNEDEIRQIVKRRRDFEYSLQRATGRQQDFLSYIRYEVALEALRARRSRKSGWKKKTISDWSGVKRVHIIFQRATRTFRGDKRMWYQYVDFCLRTGSSKVMGRVILKALQFHPREVHFWLLAADRELKLGHIKAARSLLTRALRFAPKSAKLWSEFLRLEVRVALHLLLARAESKEGEAKPAATAWAPPMLLLRQALGRLANNPQGTADVLQLAAGCLTEAKESPHVGEDIQDFAATFRAALAAKRPGIAEGKAWNEATEEASEQLWEQWWSHELECETSWSAIVEAVAASAPPCVIRYCAKFLANAGENDVLLQLSKAPRSMVDIDTTMSVLEAFERITFDSDDQKVEVVKEFLQRAAAAHPTSARLALLASQEDDGREAAASAAAVAVAEARELDEDEAATLRLLVPEARVAKKAKTSTSAQVDVLEALLRHLAADASPAQVVAAHVAAALATDGLEAMRRACDEVRTAAVKLWDMPARRASVLAAALDSELRCQGAVAVVEASPVASAKRLGGRFEELIDELSDEDPEKEDWWIRYMEFVQHISQLGGVAAGTGLANATDLHWRAMRSVANQASYADKAQRLLHQQGGGSN